MSDAMACITLVQAKKGIGELKDFHLKYRTDELRSWIRSLKSRPRTQPRWKPSEEQMCELNWASKLSPILAELYEQLKSL